MGSHYARLFYLEMSIHLKTKRKGLKAVQRNNDLVLQTSFHFSGWEQAALVSQYLGQFSGSEEP